MKRMDSITARTGYSGNPYPITHATPSDQPAELDQWLGQPRGRVYNRASWQAAKELAEPIYFRTATDAERLGYRRSEVPDC